MLETENAIAEMKRTKQRKDEDEANLLAQIKEMESQIEKRRAGMLPWTPYSPRYSTNNPFQFALPRSRNLSPKHHRMAQSWSSGRITSVCGSLGLPWPTT